uniref:CUE domain-containing protein 2 n=2 Tax=Schistocephalus solidus TaxID=70667 RepID=A0A0X3PCH3_SCHSO
MKRVDYLLHLLRQKFDVKLETDPELLDYLKVSLEDVDDEFDGDSVVDLLLEFMPKRKIPERQEILETVLEAIKQDVDVDSQHQATGIPTSGESAETVARIPIQEDLTDLILQTLPSSHASRPSGRARTNVHVEGFYAFTLTSIFGDKNVYFFLGPHCPPSLLFGHSQ